MWTIVVAFLAGGLLLGTNGGRSLLGKLAVVAVIVLALIGATVVTVGVLAH